MPKTETHPRLSSLPPWAESPPAQSTGVHPFPTKRLLVIFAALAPLISPALGGDPLSPSVSLSPFGVGSCYINNRSAADNARWIPQMEAIGLHSYRTPHTDWGAVEAKPGEWSWETLDEQMDYLAQHGMNFGGTLIGNPRWNTRDKPGSLPVNNIEGWSAYVSAVVQHAKGHIRRWEVWNEPPNFTGKDQTPADYAKIVASAYDAAKAADPSCLVGLAAKSAHLNYLEQVIRAGAKDHFEVFDGGSKTAREGASATRTWGAYAPSRVVFGAPPKIPANSVKPRFLGL